MADAAPRAPSWCWWCGRRFHHVPCGRPLTATVVTDPRDGREHRVHRACAADAEVALERAFLKRHNRSA